jgi:hypothetical protein
MNRDMFRRFDSEPDAISANFQNGDLDVVGDYDLLVFLATNNQHSTLPLYISGYTRKEKYRVRKIHRKPAVLAFTLFKFPGSSGKLVALCK